MTFVSALVVQAKNTGRFLLKRATDDSLWCFTGSHDEIGLDGQPFITMMSSTQKDLGYRLESIEAFIKTLRIDYLIHAWVENESTNIDSKCQYMWADLLHFPQDVDPSVEMVFKNKLFMERILGP